MSTHRLPWHSTGAKQMRRGQLTDVRGHLNGRLDEGGCHQARVEHTTLHPARIGDDFAALRNNNCSINNFNMKNAYVFIKNCPHNL